jgi:uncharacterized OsmC-like protein
VTISSVHDAEQTFAADPDAGRVTPRVSATLANGRARVSTGPFNFDVDLPAAVGGGNQAPSPTAYLLGALASCAVAFIADTLAPQFDVRIEELSAEAHCTTDLAGLFGLDGRDPRLNSVTLDISLRSPSPVASVKAMQRAWLDRCPVYLALREASAVTVQFNGGETEANNVG